MALIQKRNKLSTWRFLGKKRSIFVDNLFHINGIDYLNNNIFIRPIKMFNGTFFRQNPFMSAFF